MPFTCQDVCDLARTWLNDTPPVRFTDLTLEKWANAGLQAMALLRPDLFTAIGSFTVNGTTAWQDLRTHSPMADALVLYDVLGPNANGQAITECALQPLLASKPGALSETPGAPVNWARDPTAKDRQTATKFLLNPPPAGGTQLTVQWAGSPAYVQLANDMPIPISYRMALAQYIVYCAESVDDEYVTAQRAALGLQNYMGMLGAGQQTKQIEANR